MNLLPFTLALFIALVAALDLCPTNATNTSQSLTPADTSDSIYSTISSESNLYSVSIRDGYPIDSRIGPGLEVNSLLIRRTTPIKQNRPKKDSNTGDKKSSKSTGKTSSGSQKARKSKESSKSADKKHGTEHSSSASDKDPPLPQIIWAEEKSSALDHEKFERALKKKLGRRIYKTSNLDDTGVLFWLASLTKEEVKQAESNSAVRSIKPDLPVLDPGEEESEKNRKTSLSDNSKHKSDKSKPGKKNLKNASKHGSKSKSSSGKRSADWATESARNLTRRTDNNRLVGRDLQIVAQSNAPYDLATLSAHPNLPRPKDTYYYRSPAGQGVMIYGLDTGLNTHHDDVKKWLDGPTKPELRWIFASGADATEEDADAATGRGHGSCVWSKAVGPYGGAAKSASFTAVKVGKEWTKIITESKKEVWRHEILTSSPLSGLIAILHDIQKRHKHSSGNDRTATPSVVTISIGFVYNEDDNSFSTFRKVIRKLEVYDVSVFYAAPNSHGEALDLQRDPYSGLTKYHRNFFLVAGTNKQGHRWEGSAVNAVGMKPSISFWAPAEGIRCISGDGNDEATASGSSLAAPLVAGLAAYAISLPGGPRTPREVRNWLSDHSIQRVSKGPPIVANDIAKTGIPKGAVVVTH